jgi:hypothetical protein
MQEKTKNKKAEVTTHQVVLIIILIISFVIILYFLFRLNIGELTDKEICYNSVVLSSKNKITGGLDCSTSYACVSGGGECEEFSYDYKKEVNAENKEELMKAIADEMADCWWMFGEGELDYLGWRDKALPHIFCGLCASIKFDDEAMKQKISFSEFYNYLNEINKTEDYSYFEYFYYPNSVEGLKQKLSGIGFDTDSNFINDDSRYSIITGYRTAFLTEDIIFPPIYVKNSDRNSLVGCSEFITKA